MASRAMGLPVRFKRIFPRWLSARRTKMDAAPVSPFAARKSGCAI